MCRTQPEEEEKVTGHLGCFAIQPLLPRSFFCLNLCPISSGLAFHSSWNMLQPTEVQNTRGSHALLMPKEWGFIKGLTLLSGFEQSYSLEPHHLHLGTQV